MMNNFVFMKIGEAFGTVRNDALSTALNLDSRLIGGFLFACMQPSVQKPNKALGLILEWPVDLDEQKVARFRDDAIKHLCPPKPVSLIDQINALVDDIVKRKKVRTVGAHDVNKKQFVFKDVPLTAEWLLAQLLANWRVVSLSSLRNLFYNGFKGYKDYTRAELLADIGEILDKNGVMLECRRLSDFSDLFHKYIHETRDS